MTNALAAKAQTSKTEQIKEMAMLLVNDMQDGAEIVLDTLLSILEGRLPGAEFVSFCDELEAVM